jgi:catecholate siderophore receptor
VVKGPSGSDNGRGAPTGYVNLSSKVPQKDSFANASARVSSGDRLRLAADLNLGTNIESLPGFAVRLNVMSDRGGKVGRDVVESNRWGVAPSLAFGLGTPSRTYLSVLHIKQDNIPDGGIPAIGFPGYNYAFASDSTVPAPLQAQVRAAVAAAPRVNSSNFYGSASDYDRITADVFTARFENDLTPNTTLRNTTRYGRLTQQYVLTGVNALGNLNSATAVNPYSDWTVSRSRQGKNQENEILTNQTNLTTKFKTGPLQHSVSTGIEFIHERQSNVGFTTTGTLDAANLYTPNRGQRFSNVVSSGAYTKGNTTTAAVYAFETLEFSSQWQASLGLRWEKYKTEFISIPASTATSQTATNLAASDDLLTGKAGVVFKPRSNGSVYLAIATSQKPPGSDNFTLNAPPTTGTTSNINNPNLDPQTATSTELGTKWELFDNTLVLTAAVFNTINKNDQASRDPVTGEVTQYGKKTVNGIELGVAGMITPAWQVNVGLASMDTKVNSGTATQTGSGINFSPKLTFTSWTTYKLPFGLTIGGGARHVDSQTTSVSNSGTAPTNLPQIPSYWVFDAMAGYEINKHINLQLNVANVADKEYITSLNSGRSRYTLGAPRNVSLSANFQF